jgi:hydroxymethylbilane synthase
MIYAAFRAAHARFQLPPIKKPTPGTFIVKLVFATRPSALARWQTQWVITALQAAHPRLVCAEKVITTQGDKVLDRPLPEIGGKGLFTQELESELLSSAVHCAVHSLKDLPVENPAGLTVGCIPARAEVRDALISGKGYSLATLPTGAVVGTSSLRRAAQILAVRPDVTIQSLRGNVDTRLGKVGAGPRPAPTGQYDAIILAGAGLTRLGLEGHVTEWLPLDVMLPAPGQGALAIQCRADDPSTLGLLAALNDDSARKAVTAERQFLLGLGGGCAVPVAAYAQTIDHGLQTVVSLTGLVISPDGKQSVKVMGQGADAVKLGKELAQQAIAQGASDILELITIH